MGVEEAYAAVADRYVELFGSVDHVHPDDVDLIDRHLTIRVGTVLDVGCGPGHLTAHLIARDVTALGLDRTRAFVEHGRSSFGLDRLLVATVQRLPIRAASVDGILAWYSLIHLSPHEIDGALAELRRIATPGAPMVVGFFDGDEVGEFDHRVTAAYRWPVDELSRRLATAGWTETERRRRPADPSTGSRAHAALVVSAS